MTTETLPHHPISTGRVDTAGDEGTLMGAYFARPSTTGPFPGVVVAMELFGVDAQVRAACDGDALQDGGVRHEFVVYPGAGHGFLHSDPAAADDAWRRVHAFLRDT
jgi:dienelactone hydrolase